MRHRRHDLPPIPPAFIAKKTTILSSLARPDETYTDASPKGSVDDAIKDLIHRLNALEGIVTTSSCAGRVSVFAEGKKEGDTQAEPAAAGSFKQEQCKAGGTDSKANPNIARGDDDARGREKGVPGGKGFGGRWLYVSHEPIPDDKIDEDLSTLFGLPFQAPKPNGSRAIVNRKRLVRFQFEPMILHIMCASLHYAHPVLTAAINAGFRESGVQSLKNLDDTNAFPMVAVRSSGLAFESLVGYVEEGSIEDGYEVVQRVVDPNYLQTLAVIANERFLLNKERIHKFETGMFKDKEPFEPSSDRAARKKSEGLRRKAEKESHCVRASTEEDPELFLPIQDP